MLKNGTLPGTQNMAPEAKEKVLAKMRYGGNRKNKKRKSNTNHSNGHSFKVKLLLN